MLRSRSGCIAGVAGEPTGAHGAGIAVTMMSVLTVRSVKRARVLVVVTAATMLRFVSTVVIFESYVVASVEEAVLDEGPCCHNVSLAREMEKGTRGQWKVNICVIYAHICI